MAQNPRANLERKCVIFLGRYLPVVWGSGEKLGWSEMSSSEIRIRKREIKASRTKQLHPRGHSDLCTGPLYMAVVRLSAPAAWSFWHKHEIDEPCTTVTNLVWLALQIQCWSFQNTYRQDWDIQDHSKSQVTKFNSKGSYPFAYLLYFLHSCLISWNVCTYSLLSVLFQIGCLFSFH